VRNDQVAAGSGKVMGTGVPEIGVGAGDTTIKYEHAHAVVPKDRGVGFGHRASVDPESEPSDLAGEHEIAAARALGETEAGVTVSYCDPRSCSNPLLIFQHSRSSSSLRGLSVVPKIH